MTAVDEGAGSVEDAQTKVAPDVELGARWVRAALQVNPYGYVGNNAPSSSFASEDAYNAALVAECLAQNIEVIAITDHWAVDSAKGLMGAAEAAGITAFPGFEANSAEGKHLLIIFDPSCSLAQINAAIGACGATPGCQNGTPGKPFEEILEAMSERGAMVIPAHANIDPAGLLTNRSGPPLVRMVTNPNLHAIAISPAQAEGIDQAAIFQGRSPYERAHPLSEVYADDVCHPDMLASAGATTYFKVSSSTLESFKLAIRTPVTRVATSAPVSAARVTLGRISWQGGLFDGIDLPLSSELTTLIGGKGTGKSTVIESLRFALQIDPIGAEAKRDHKGIVTDVLGAGTTVTVSLEQAQPARTRYSIQRSVGDVAVVKDANGEVTALRPQDITGTVEIYGQHELAELAQDKDSVAQMLQRFAGNELSNPDHTDVLGDLRENRRKFAETEKDLALVQADVDDIPRVEGQLRQYAASALPERLKEQEQLRLDQNVIKIGEDRIRDAREKIASVADAQAFKSLLTEIEDIAASANKELLARVPETLGALSATVKESLAAIESALAAAETEVAQVRTDWETATVGQREKHQETLRQLTEEGLEPDKYLATVGKLAALREKLQTRTELLDEVASLQAARTTLLAKLSDSETTMNQQLNEAVRKANEATSGQVVVRPVPSPNRAAIMTVVDRYVSGNRTQIRDAVNTTDFSPRAFVAAARSGAKALEDQYGVRGAQATGLIDAGEPLLRELEEQTIPKAVEILLNVAPLGGERELKKLEDLSKGQRATALLLLLLGASESPLIIDQPEDDLDNRFVYDGVVQRLRDLKGKRQIIVSTHNANIPVLGDAELVIGLDGNGSNSWPIKDGIGSLDNAEIRCLAEDLLEGGRTAFEARQHLYGF